MATLFKLDMADRCTERLDPSVIIFIITKRGLIVKTDWPSSLFSVKYIITIWTQIA
jgi:hypothetical protein